DAGITALAEVCWLTARVAGGDLSCRRLLNQTALDLVAKQIPLEVPLVTVNAGLALIWAGDHDGARSVLAKLEAGSRSAPAPVTLAAVLTARAILEHRTARWVLAEASATEAYELAVQTGQQAMAGYAAAVLTTVEAILGRAESCRARCLALLAGPGREVGVVRTTALSALGLLELGEGRPAEAARWFEVLAGSGASVGANPGLLMWGGDLAEAYIRSGQPEKARAVVEQLEDRVGGTGGERAAANARRCRAMLIEDDVEAEALFAEALRHYGGADRRFGRARTELARGERLVASGHGAEGRARLERARALFAEMGVRGWTARAEEQLASLGPMHGVISAPAHLLTPLELQIAGAAAFGGGTADIAAGLFLSEATVTIHLRSAMAKLGVAAPSELGDVSGLFSALGASAPVNEARPRPLGPAGADDEPAVHIRLLGTFEITSGGAPAESPAGVVGHAVKRVALAGRLPIEELVEELWPDEAPGVGRTRFRSLLNRLRRGVGPLLVRDGDWVTLAPGVEVDVHRFEEAVGAARAFSSSADPGSRQTVHRALDLYGGELLPTDRHLVFTAGPRERLRRRYLGMVGLAVDDAGRRGDVEAAVRLLEKAISTDPHDEALYVQAASILAGSGRRSEAASMLRRARAMLSDLDLPLSREALELEQSLRTVD
ncbi:MAG TPA: BTAD domain-containing putative transcriptional regulator, partial [Acidimicrobiales bacterium]|nr:BTAD domain-containing putative transcriptional regulator [Acidimicrobiales bacterium]